jgi:fumarylpyruvate hydrolase
MGRPWEVGKAFEGSAPIGPIQPVSNDGHIMAGCIRLDVNGETRQQGDLNQMIWKVPEIISYLSEYFELAAGDIILTGTPAGVGPTVRGDALRLKIEGLSVLEVDVV